MKIIHLPYTYFPDPAAGTEYYVQALAKGLMDRGVDSLVAAPGHTNDRYVHEGVPVVRLGVSSKPPPLRAQYADGDESVTNQFSSLLDEYRPDVVHFHAFTSAASLPMVKEVKSRKIPLVTTYHTPSISCPRGTLLHWGNAVCDGEMRTLRCSSCVLHNHGLNRMASSALGMMPGVVGSWLGERHLEGGVWTALRMSELIGARHQAVRTLWDIADRIVVLCEWTRRLLRRNHVQMDKVFLCRHGLTQSSPSSQSTNPKRPYAPIRLVFLGRLEPVKGPHLVLNAMQSLPLADLRLDLYGITQGENSLHYQQSLQKAASEDGRIRILPPVPGEMVTDLLRTYDALVVPSQSLETGPLVVLEAFASGIPVIGSHLGGIAEWVIHEQNGLLVAPFNDVGAWTRAIERLVQEEQLLDKLTNAISHPRTMAVVTQEMLMLYKQLV